MLQVGVAEVELVHRCSRQLLAETISGRVEIEAVGMFELESKPRALQAIEVAAG